jgi:hypothetical protein
VLGRPARQDPEDVRGGGLNVFLRTGPLRGWRAVLAREQRTHRAGAVCSKPLVDSRSPEAARLVLVTDYCTPQSLASRDAALPAAEARRLAATGELPKPGSWRNLAAIERAVLQRQGRRRPDRDPAARAVAAGAARRNAAASPVAWQFTTADTRTTRRRRSPAFAD